MLLSNHNFVAFHCIMDINYCHITDSRTPILGRVFSCEKKCFDSTFFQKCHVCISSELTNNEYNSPCLCCNTFTGKEKDSETGFYYFGARYYDPALSGLFLSVDPMADKYPSISPYAYCAWNPVKLVDPDGDSLRLIGTEDCKSSALAQMQSKTRNLFFSYDNNGTVTYDGTPESDMEKYMTSILDNENVLVNLEVQKTNYNPKGIIKKGGAFYGNEISEDGKSVTTMQAINLITSEKFDKLCKNNGNMIWHEIAESYEGGIISLKRKENATPAYILSNNTVYSAAHYNAGRFFPGTIHYDPFHTFIYTTNNNCFYTLETLILKENYKYERK